MTSSTSPDAPRTPTAVDQIAERWVDTLVDLEPAIGTYIGRNEANDRYGDYSPAGHERYVEAVRRTLADLEAARPVDGVDDVTKTDLGSELRLTLESSDAKLHLRDLNVIESPSQQIREVYDLMPTETADDWEVVSRRMAGVGRRDRRLYRDAAAGHPRRRRSGPAPGARSAAAGEQERGPDRVLRGVHGGSG